MTPEPATSSASTVPSRRSAKPVVVSGGGGGGAEPGAIAPAIEAILLTSDRPVPAGRLAEALRLGSAEAPAASGEPAGAPEAGAEGEGPARPAKGKPPAKGDSGPALVRRAIDLLNEQYTQTSRAFRIEEVAGGYRIMTLPQFADAVAAFQSARARTALTHAALETLAIIAYKQPITRAQLEAIRGVACGDILRSLIDRRLVTIAGRAEELGRPMLYSTTKQFLEVFGLSSVKDLPTIEELRARAAESADAAG